MNATEAKGAAVVIPCLNEEAHIGRVIDELLADEGWPDPLIVVADGGSTDRSREIVSAIAARDPCVRLIPNPNRLQGAGMNVGARAVLGRRWMVRADAHADYPPNYVSTLVAEAERTGAQSVVVSMLTQGRSCFQTAAAAAQNSILGNGGSAHRAGGTAGFVDHGHHALIDLDRFLQLGGYDEGFTHNEDAEFDVRLTRGGGRIWMTDAVRITYYPRASVPALFRQYVNHGDGRARNILRNRIRPKLRQLAPAAVAPALVLALASPAWAPLALPALLWFFGSLASGLVLGLRQRSACACASGAAAVTMHLGWSIGFWRRVLMSLGAQRPARPATLAEGAR
ncbi:MAG TPA: glycosyltransferase family 2 protein [Caulobacteraceae bacterium]|nr:glycosyltransferase family 2 protein [Caulobacteraceae bacterium]